MRFISTRGAVSPLGFSAALEQGLAVDGGLYVPDQWPQFSPQDFADAETLPEVARCLLQPFFYGDALESQLASIVDEAFNFAAPIRHLAPPATGELHLLELFHGPTAAFKDFGARFLAACFARLRQAQDKPLNILVATSGDTGGAVAAAFHRRVGLAVTVLFPKGLVSPTQERQLTCWGENVRSFAVEGSFDDCQRLVKAAFLDTALNQRQSLSSANSINLGRLLPQTVYYAATGLAHWRQHGRAPSFIIPSGNLGNAVACVWARHMGLPVGEIILAHNANRTVPDYFENGTWQPRASIATLASAMDVGHPSNMERLQSMFSTAAQLRTRLEAFSINDTQIRQRIRTDFSTMNEVWCPHTATAAEVWSMLPEERRVMSDWVLVATASPAKFPEIVEPLIGRKVAVPSSLASLFTRPSRAESLLPQLDDLRQQLLTQAH